MSLAAASIYAIAPAARADNSGIGIPPTGAVADARAASSSLFVPADGAVLRSRSWAAA